MDEISYQLTTEEILEHTARDGALFASLFLAKTFSLESPSFHKEIWATIENPDNQYVCIEVFRDGAKTTITRAFVLKSICFATVRLILFISESQTHARNSIDWLQKRVTEKLEGLCVSKFFKLKVGKIDNRNELEIINQLYGTTIRVIAIGADSQVRGFNIDDDRPDLIVADDYLPAEIMGDVTRDFYVNKFFGGLVNALAARTINPYSKVINLATRTAEEDVIGMCEKDPRWICKKFSIFDEKGESRWKSKWSTAKLLLDKQADAAKNMLSVWYREKECKLIKSEVTTFKDSWLSLYDEEDDGWIYFLACDPVPPPSPHQIATGLKHKDWEVWSVVGYKAGRFRLAEQTQNKGHDILWTLDEAFHLMRKWKPKAIGIESVAYQRTIAYQLRERMRLERNYTQVLELDDKRSKYHKIADTLSSITQTGNLDIQRNCSTFQIQFAEYPGGAHDDHLDSCQLGINTAKEYLGGQYLIDQPGQEMKTIYDKEFEKLQKEGGSGLCP